MATILIVDDYSINREFLITLLNYQNHYLLEASDGVEALEVLRKKPVDLIITDILMPNLDGYSLAQSVRADPALSEIPIIFYTATYRESEAQLLANSCGVEVVLAKPSPPDVILREVNKILEIQSTHHKTSIDLIEYKEKSKNKFRENFSRFLDELNIFNDHCNKLIDIEKKIVSKNTNDLSVQLKKLHASNSQTVAILGLVFNLIADRDITKLLPLFNKTLCQIIGANVAAINISNDKENIQEHFYNFQGNTSQISSENAFLVSERLLKQITTEQRAVRIAEVSLIENEEKKLLPPLANTAFLGVPISSDNKNYGVFYLIGKLDDSAFTEKDELIALTISSELGVLYENIQIYDTVQQHAAHLQLEITERRQAEQALEQSEGQFRQFAAHAQEVFWMSTPDLKKIIYVNPAFKTIWKRPVNSLYQNPNIWLEAVHPDDKANVAHAFTETLFEKTVDIEYRILQPDGTLRWIHNRGFFIRNSQGDVYCQAGIASDITERKQAEELAHQHQAHLAQIGRINSMGEIASALAHELNQPLTAINSYINGCIRRLEEGTEQKDAILMAMKKAVQNTQLAGEIIHRMKNFVRQGELHYEKVDINEIIKEAASLIHYELYNVPITIDMELASDLPIIAIDKIQILQVLLNLLRNGIEAMIEIKLKKPKIILKTALLNSHTIIVSVCDQGPGILAENIDSLFNLYFTTKLKGMGMGLAISRTIIEAHAGQISAFSLPKSGACFQFTLPVINQPNIDKN